MVPVETPPLVTATPPPIVVPAQSPEVYSGCGAPSSLSAANVFYADPLKGSMSNDGSLAHPWAGLSSVIASGRLPPSASAVVKAGDTIYLMSGSHGVFDVRDVENSSYITIQAAVGQSPVLSGVVVGGSHWAFRGLTIRKASVSGELTKGFTLNNGNSTHPITDIIVDNNSFTTDADTTSFTEADWIAHGLTAPVTMIGSCLSITNNLISNTRNGIYVEGSNILIKGNKVDHFGDDGIDFAATGSSVIRNVEISHNTVTNNFSLNDGNHNDGIQGWVLNGTVGSNIKIDSNTIIAHLDPNLQMKGAMQGISEFDGSWDQLNVTNNVVIASLYHGIMFGGAAASNSSIVNNVVFGNYTASNGDVNQTWIGMTATATNVLIRNNISSTYIIPPSGAVADHNIQTSTPQSYFTQYDGANYKFNLKPSIGSPLLGAGTTLLAPSTDITGIIRGGTNTVGAYQNP